MKRFPRAAAVILFCTAFFSSLSSCSPRPGSVMDSALLYIGIDARDYKGEAVIETLDPRSDLALSLAETIRMLTLDSPYMKEFSSAKSLPALYTDELLTYLLNSRYSKYSGNPELLTQVAEKYPSLGATTVIPADDFDALLRKFFGGSANIPHPDGKIFRYLSKVSAYVTEAQPFKNTVQTEILSCESTEHTHRLTFRNHAGALTSPDYTAIFVKGEEKSSPYLKLLFKAENSPA